MKKKLIVILLSLCFVYNYASAEVYGGKWASNPSYYHNTSNPYSTEFNQAISSWNGVLSSIGSALRIRSGSATGATVMVSTANYYDLGWDGYCKPGPDPYSGTYTYADMKLNTFYMDNFTSDRRKSVITHEFGHCLGLAHTETGANRSIMYITSNVYYGQWNLTSPTSYDIDNLDSLY